MDCASTADPPTNFYYIFVASLLLPTSKTKSIRKGNINKVAEIREDIVRKDKQVPKRNKYEKEYQGEVAIHLDMEPEKRKSVWRKYHLPKAHLLYLLSVVKSTPWQEDKGIERSLGRSTKGSNILCRAVGVTLHLSVTGL